MLVFADADLEKSGLTGLLVLVGGMLGSLGTYVVKQWLDYRKQLRDNTKQDRVDTIAEYVELCRRYKEELKALGTEKDESERRCDERLNKQARWMQYLTIRCERLLARIELHEEAMRAAGMVYRPWIEPPLPKGVEAPDLSELPPIPPPAPSGEVTK